jgi:uncharacterized Ntn-hydrolase superfamily protein
MTYSILARDPATGAIGIAVASRFFACGSLVPHIGRGVAVATQAFINPMWGVEGVRRLQAGESADAVMADVTRRDAGQAQRQAHMMDAQGHSAVFTGADCIDWAGHIAAQGFSVAGNMLAGPAVIQKTAETWQARTDLPFADRLLAAMQAGEDAGGDKRGRQAAGLRIHMGQDYPWLDLRVDDHADPLSELRRLWAVAQERYIHVAEIMPTAEQFSGAPDRRDTDAKILAAQILRDAEGRPSASHATTQG